MPVIRIIAKDAALHQIVRTLLPEYIIGREAKPDLLIAELSGERDSLGAETPIPMHDWVDIGVYRRPARGERSPSKDGVPISVGKQLIRDSTQHIVLTTTELPSRAGIDPLHKLISRLTTQNTIGVQDRSKRKRAPLKARRLP